MAKQDKPKKERPPSRADAVRSAVDQAFSASAAQAAASAGQGRERAQDIVDQLAQAAGRVRDVLDELRPPTGDEVKSLRSSIESLERRVGALERAMDAQPKTARATGKRSTAPRTSSSRGGGDPSGKA